MQLKTHVLLHEWDLSHLLTSETTEHKNMNSHYMSINNHAAVASKHSTNTCVRSVEANWLRKSNRQYNESNCAHWNNIFYDVLQAESVNVASCMVLCFLWYLANTLKQNVLGCIRSLIHYKIKTGLENKSYLPKFHLLKNWVNHSRANTFNFLPHLTQMCAKTV